MNNDDDDDDDLALTPEDDEEAFRNLKAVVRKCIARLEEVSEELKEALAYVRNS